MSVRYALFVGIILSLSGLLAACGRPAAPTPASTIPAVTDQPPPAASTTPSPVPTPIASPTLEAPKPTMTAAATHTSTKETASATPMVTAKNSVNLRQGPGAEYTVAGTMITGEKAEIIGKSDESGTWLKIKVTDTNKQTKEVWILASSVDQTAPLKDVPIVIKPPTPIAETTKNQELALYPVAFELPLKAEVDGIQVNLTVGFTDRFAQERGYKGITVAREDAAKEHAAVALKMVWRSWVSDDSTGRANITYDQWVGMVKKGEVVLKIPAVDGSVNTPNKNQGRQIRDWELKIENGKPTMDLGAVFDITTVDNGFVTLPLDLSTKDHINLVLFNGKLFIVGQFHDNESSVQKDYGIAASDAEKAVDVQFSGRICKLIATTRNIDQNVMTGKGDILAVDTQLIQLGRDFSSKMSGGTSGANTISDDKPFLTLTR